MHTSLVLSPGTPIPASELSMSAKQPEAPIVVSGPMAWIAKSLGIQPWGQILILLLVGSGYYLHTELDRIDKSLNVHDTSLKMLPLEISKDLLSQAETDLKLGRPERATRATETAKAIIAKASVQRVPAPAQYFSETLGALNSLRANSSNGALLDSAYSAQLLLADYRSALEPLPADREKKEEVTKPLTASELIEKQGTTFEFVNATSDTQLIEDIGGLEHMTIVAPHGGYIVIDNLHLDTVVFVGVRIKYLGGRLDLNYVRFVNCTFEMPSSSNSPRLIEYVALAQNKLSPPA
jgi:hypothetical protein